jgi:hypothetical protein
MRLLLLHEPGVLESISSLTSPLQDLLGSPRQQLIDGVFGALGTDATSPSIVQTVAVRAAGLPRASDLDYGARLVRHYRPETVILVFAPTTTSDHQVVPRFTVPGVRVLSRQLKITDGVFDLVPFAAPAGLHHVTESA